MKRFSVRFSDDASDQIRELRKYIAAEAGSDIAKRFVDGIITQCGKLETFPLRGTPRDDLRPGIRTITCRRRTVIAYLVEGEIVLIIGLFYGGRDYEAAFRDPPAQN